MSSGQPPVDVAVVSWNTRDLLDRCLRSLRPAAERGLARVWVVDNASTDGSAGHVRDHHPWAELIASDENLGYGRAVNLVAERTSGPWLGIANADVAVRGDAIERLLAAGAADPGAGLLAPRLILPDGATQHSVKALPDLGAMTVANLGPVLTPARLGRRFVMPWAWDPERGRRVPWAIAAFLLARRTAWEDVGGFDPAQWMSAEDLDLGWRMHRGGWSTRYVPEAVVDHEESAAVAQRWGADLPLHWQRCAYAWMLRRLGRSRTVAIGALNLGGALLRLAAYALVARDRLPAQAAWARVQLYAIAPRRTLDRYR